MCIGYNIYCRPRNGCSWEAVNKWIDRNIYIFLSKTIFVTLIINNWDKKKIPLLKNRCHIDPMQYSAAIIWPHPLLWLSAVQSFTITYGHEYIISSHLVDEHFIQNHHTDPWIQNTGIIRAAHFITNEWARSRPMREDGSLFLSIPAQGFIKWQKAEQGMGQ